MNPSDPRSSCQYAPRFLGRLTLATVIVAIIGTLLPQPSYAKKARKPKPPTLRLSVAPSSITEGRAATFTISASAPVLSETVVNYIIGGNAQPGTHYTLSGSTGSVAIPTGASSATVIVNALVTGLSTGSETITMKIAPGTGYKPVPRAKPVVVTIINAPPPGLPLQLSSGANAPGKTLVATATGLDPDLPTYFIFTDQSGHQLKVRSLSVTATTADVAVPVFVDMQQFRITAGSVSVKLVQQAAAGDVFYGPVNFQINDLPVTNLATGMVTLEVLEELQRELDSASQSWLLIESSSGGVVDTASLRANIVTLQAQLAADEAQIQQLLTGNIAQISLGHIGGKALFIDKNSLALLDRLFAAYLANGEGTVAARGSASVASARALTVPCPDTLQCVDHATNPTIGQGTEGIFSAFEKLEKIGSTAAGITEAGAIGYGSTAVASAAGTVSPMLFFTSTIVPGVVGLAVESFADPFIELELGHPISEQDYQEPLNHIEKGSVAFLQGEMESRLFEGLLPRVGADETTARFLSKYLPASKDLLAMTDLASPTSPPQQAFANSGSIFSNLPHSYFNLTISVVGNGSGFVTPSIYGLNCGDGCLRYIKNVVLTLTPTPTLGSTFVGFSGSVSGSGPVSLTMNSDKAVTAEFAATPTCSFDISPTSAHAPFGGGTGSVSVTTTFADCKWTAASNSSFISINSSGGSGNGSVGYSVTANSSSSSRTGTITVAGQTFTVTQDGAPSANMFDGTYVGTLAGQATCQTPFGPVSTSVGPYPFTFVVNGQASSNGHVDVITPVPGTGSVEFIGTITADGHASGTWSVALTGQPCTEGGNWSGTRQ